MKLRTLGIVLAMLALLGLSACTAADPANPDQGQRDDTAKTIVQTIIAGDANKLDDLAMPTLLNRKQAADALIAQGQGLGTDYSLEYSQNSAGDVLMPESVTVKVKQKASSTAKLSFLMGWRELNGEVKWWLVIGDQNPSVPGSSPATANSPSTTK